MVRTGTRKIVGAVGLGTVVVNAVDLLRRISQTTNLSKIRISLLRDHHLDRLRKGVPRRLGPGLPAEVVAVRNTWGDLGISEKPRDSSPSTEAANVTDKREERRKRLMQLLKGAVIKDPLGQEKKVVRMGLYTSG